MKGGSKSDCVGLVCPETGGATIYDVVGVVVESDEEKGISWVE